MPEKKIRWIALTGTMASGKSTVLSLLKKAGYPVYSADEISRQLTQINQQGYQAIVLAFGKEMLSEDQTLDRVKLADIVFHDEAKRKQLEAILHPLIRHQIQEAKQQNQTISFVEVPLLFECGWEKDFDESWLVTCSQETCIKRCMENRKMSRQAILDRIRTQMSVEEKEKSGLHS